MKWEMRFPVNSSFVWNSWHYWMATHCWNFTFCLAVSTLVNYYFLWKPKFLEKKKNDVFYQFSLASSCSSETFTFNFLEFELKTVLMNCQMLFLTRWLEILRGEKHLAIIMKKLPLYSMYVFFNQKWKKHNVVSCRKWIFK